MKRKTAINRVSALILQVKSETQKDFLKTTFAGFIKKYKDRLESKKKEKQ